MVDQTLWPTTAIGEVADVFDGPHATPTKTNTGPIFLGISSLDSGRLDLSNTNHLSEKDFKKWTRRVVPRTGDVVFSYETRIGQAAIIPPRIRCCLGRRLALVRPKEGRLDSKFFLYQYLGPEFQEFLKSRTNPGSTVNRILLTEFPEFPIVLPPLHEQRAIARVLGALDDKIELNREMNRTLEATAQALFRSWFVDFDPVVAKADGRKPFGMSDDLAALFPDRFVESELGPIPEGWEILSLGEAGNWLSGGTPSKKNPDYWGGEFPWISAKSIEFLCRWSEDRITETALESGAKIAPKGSVLFVVRGMSLASEFRFGLATRELSFNQDLKAIVPTGRVDPALTLLYLASSCPNILDLVDEASHGTKRLETQLLQDLQMVVPKPEIQKQLAPTLWALIDQMLCNEEENETLAGLRDLLLPKLLSGEIRVAEAKEVAAAAGA